MKLTAAAAGTAAMLLLGSASPALGFSVGAVPGVCGVFSGTAHVPCRVMELFRQNKFEPVHQGITSFALGLIAYSPSKQPTGDAVRFSRRVLLEIEDANGQSDAMYYSDHFVHFDNSELRAASMLVKDKKERILRLLQSPEPLAGQEIKTSRRLLGEALHSIQDFYSHSNWVETHGTGPIDGPAFGSEILLNPPSVEDEFANTWFCFPTTSVLSGRGRSVLLTGYTDSLTRAIAPLGQCAHGLLGNGIHKDWSSRLQHGLARTHAELASQRFTQSVLNAPENAGHEDNVCIFMTGAPCEKRQRGYTFETFDPPGDLEPVGLWLTKASINKFSQAVFTYSPIPGEGNPGIRGLLHVNGVGTTIHAPDTLIDDPLLDEFCRPRFTSDTVICSVMHTVPRAMNDSGEMVGAVGIKRIQCFLNSMNQQRECDGGVVMFLSFRRSGGVFAILPAGDAYDISNSGTVLMAEKFGPIGTAPYATGINSRGQIVGFDSFSFESSGFLYSNGAFLSINAPGLGTLPFGINDLGQIAGMYWKNDGFHAFVASPPYGAEDFVTIDVPGGSNTEGLGMNVLGQVVGIYYDDNLKKSRYFIATPRTP